MSATRNNPDWQHERSMRLQRICMGVEQRLQRRRGLRRAVRVAAWRWKSRCYRSDPSKRVHFSRSTLMTAYRLWRDNGRKPDVFRLNYRSGKSKLPARLLKYFVRLCGEPGVDSMIAAYRNLAARWRDGDLQRPHVYRRAAELPFTYSTFRRALSLEQRQVIVAFQKTERAARRARQAFERISTD
jgi:hypothetical protein